MALAELYQNSSNNSFATSFMEEDHNSRCAFTLNFIDAPDSVVVDRMFFSKWESFLITYAFPIILFFGFLGNVAFLFTLMRVRSMQTITNAYLANLSAADLCFIIFIGFRYIWTIVSSPKVYSNPFKQDAACLLMDFVTYLAYFASSGVVNLVSYERYLAICHPLKHRYFNSKKRTAKLIIAMWVISFVVAASMAPRATNSVRYCVAWPNRQLYHDLPIVLYTCRHLSDIYEYYPPILQTAVFIISFGINVVFYTFIVSALMKRQVVKETNNEFQTQNQVRNTSKQVARMLILNSTVFFLCLAPFQFFGVQVALQKLSNGKIDLLNAEQSSVLFWASSALNCINASINPFIYNIANSKYRNAFIQALGCWRNHGKEGTIKRKQSCTNTTTPSTKLQHE